MEFFTLLVHYKQRSCTKYLEYDISNLHLRNNAIINTTMILLLFLPKDGGWTNVVLAPIDVNNLHWILLEREFYIMQSSTWNSATIGITSGSRELSRLRHISFTWTGWVRVFSMHQSTVTELHLLHSSTTVQ